MYKPYLIRVPEYSTTSGGIKVMYGLYGWLLAKGIEVHLNVKANVPSIGIYPEIFYGNEMESEKVIRYILNKPGFMSSFGVPGPTKFDPTDEIYVFSRIYDTFGVNDNHILFLPILNLSLFKNQKRNRRNTCFFVGKGKDMGLHPNDAIKITRSIASDQEQLADLFNVCSVMYTYENPTAMVEIARLTGCRVVYFSQGSATSYTRKELTELYEPGMEGVSFDKDEGIELDVRKFREHYISLIKTFERKLDRFIIHTQV